MILLPTAHIPCAASHSVAILFPRVRRVISHFIFSHLKHARLVRVKPQTRSTRARSVRRTLACFTRTLISLAGRPCLVCRRRFAVAAVLESDLEVSNFRQSTELAPDGNAGRRKALYLYFLKISTIVLFWRERETDLLEIL